MNKIISVIVPCYNVGIWVDDSIENILRQTYKNIEIICINDASTDDTLFRLQKLAHRDSRMKVVELTKNAGVGHALNLGLKIAQGEYICYVDPDDFLINTTFFNDGIKMFENNSDATIVAAKSIMFVNPHVLKLKEFWLPEWKRNFYSLNEQGFASHTNDANPYLICSNNNHVLWSKIYRKSFLKKINLFFPENDIFPWDGVDALWLPIIFAFAKILLLDNFVYLYNRHVGSLSYDKKMIRQNPPNKQWETFLINWWIGKFDLLAQHNLISFVGSPIIKLLREHYYNTRFADTKWLQDNFLSKYKIDLTSDNYHVKIYK